MAFLWMHFDWVCPLDAVSRKLPSVWYLANAQDSGREMAWTTTNLDLTYVNQWVALNGDEEVSSRTDDKVVYQGARADGIAAPFLY